MFVFFHRQEVSTEPNVENRLNNDFFASKSQTSPFSGMSIKKENKSIYIKVEGSNNNYVKQQSRRQTAPTVNKLVKGHIKCEEF